MKIWTKMSEIVGGAGQVSAETAPNNKPTYVSPTVITYKTQTLMQQLGPARAFSGGRSLDEELLFPDQH